MAETTRLIGAVGIKVRPVTKGFREEVQEDLRRLPDGEVKVTVDADTRKAKQKIKEVSEDQTAMIRVGVTYDDLQKAKKQLENELKRMTDLKMPVKMDEAGIREAIGKLNDIAKRAKIVMKIDEDQAGYQSVVDRIKALQREKIMQEVKIDVSKLDQELAKYERKVAEHTKPREISIRYSEDAESLQAALRKVEQELRELDAIQVPITADKESLTKARESIREMLKDSPIKMKFTQDEAGYQALLAKIKSLKSQRTEIDVEINTDEASLENTEREVQAALDRLQGKSTIKLEMSDDRARLKQQIAKIDAELEKLRRVEIEIDLDDRTLEEARADLAELLDKSQIDIEYGTDEASLKAAKARLDAVMAEKEFTKLTVDTDDESLRRAREKIDGLIKDAEDKKIQIPVEPAGLAIAAGQLAWVSRARTVPFYIRINQKSLTIAEGILKSLSGYNTLSAMGRTLERLVTNFDTILLKTAAVSTLLGGVVNGLTYAGTAALGIGDGMSRVVGLLATAPAAVAALSVGVLVNVAAWKNFKGAIDGNKEALAALPAAARAAAVALQGTWTEIQKPTQNNFWEAMGTSLQDMVETLLPQVRDGFAETATHAGRFAASTFDTMNRLAQMDGMRATFSNIATMFDRAAGAAAPFTEAISTLGLRGAEFLPQFGQWLTDLAVRFNDFIQEADGLGRINQWIKEGVQSLKDMWKAGDGIIDVLRGITGAAMDAGTNDLGTFADNMQRMGEIVQSEPFRSRLATIFEGARAGASALNAGIKDLGRAFGESAPFVSDMLTKLGRLGGLTFTNVSKLFSGKTFQGGITEALDGLLDMASGLEPAFFNIGKVIGNLGKTAGAAFRGLTPLINTVADALAEVTDTLSDELPGAATALLRYLTGTFSTIASIVSPLATLLGGVLKIFNDMPAGMQTMLVAFGAFTLMRNQVSTLFTALGNTRAFTALEEKWRQQQMLAGNASAATQRFNAGTASLSLARQYVGNVGEAFRQAGAQADTAAGKIGGVSRVIGGGLVSAGKGLFALMGGPWGVVLAGAMVGLSLYAKKQREAQQKVDDHTAALQAQKGAIGEANVDIIANSLLDDNGGKAVETLKALKMSVQDTASAVAEGGESYDFMIKKLDSGISAFDSITNSVGENGNMVTGNTSKWDEWTKSMGITSDAVHGVDLRALKAQLEAERGSLERSIGLWKDRNDSMRPATGISEAMAGSIKILGDAAGDAEGRLRAYRDILDQLNGTSKTAWERQRELSASSRDLAGFLSEVDVNGARLNTGLIDLSTGFTIHTEAGDRFGGMLDNLQSQAFTAGRQAYDMAGGLEKAGEASAAANAAMEPYRQQLQSLADQGLITQEEVDAVSRALFGVPGSTPFELTDQNSIATVQLKVQGLHEQILATPDKSITITEPLSPAIVQKLIDLGYVVTHLPNGDIHIGEKGLDETGAAIDREAGEYRQADITGVADVAQAEKDINYTARKRLVDFGSTGGNFEFGGILTSVDASGMVRAFANGGFNIPGVNNVKRYASGGRENHVAQIARATPSVPIRIWGEEESGGEAYIPLAASKRPRSVSILNQVAQQFGYNLSRSGTAYANGGITTGGSTGGSVAVNIGSYITQKSDTPDDVARALMRRVKAQGAYSPLEAF